MNEGTQQRWLVDLGLYLRKAGHLVDYVKLQDWLKRLGMERMARHIGMLLAGSLHLSHDEIPFMSSDEGPYAEPTTHDLFQYHPANKNQWYFQQQEHDIFVSTTNSSAMFRQARRSAKYFTYYPSESITNFLTSFSHSLSHIEE